MKTQTAVITGGTSGIGKSAALKLANEGATVIIIARNSEKANATIHEITQYTGNYSIHYYLADLTSFNHTMQAAKLIASHFPSIDILVNNAGIIMGKERELTVDGQEVTFQVNHLSHFLLTSILMPNLKKSTSARIINVTSEVHRFADFDIEDPDLEKGYSSMRAYGNAKLCTLLFTHILSKKLENIDNVITCSLHPGVIASNFASTASPGFRFLIKLIRPFLKSTQKGAETIHHLIKHPEPKTLNGFYFKNKKQTKPIDMAEDENLGHKLWHLSENLTGIKFEL